jgi:hypothetical protein
MSGSWLVDCFDIMVRNILKDLTIEVYSQGPRSTYTFSLRERDD